jgi:hypothetical protein
LAEVAERLEALLMSQSGVLFDLNPSSLTAVVQKNMRSHKPLSPEAQSRLAGF